MKNRFSNPSPSATAHKNSDLFRYLFTKEKSHWPKKIEIKKLHDIQSQAAENMMFASYVGHATFLLQIDGLNILTDPIWSDKAGPFNLFGPKRVSAPGIDFENLPKIDVILISHNHYDHLDIKTIRRLHKAYKPKIITPLGNDRIIRDYMLDADISCLNWEESYKFKNLEFCLEPAQHWSARTLFDVNKDLWGTFIIRSKNIDICFIGDTGYDEKIFKKIGEKYNIFLSIIPIGAYKPRWFMQTSHVDPKEAIEIFKDLKSKYALSSHFDCFPLATEDYGEAPAELEKNLEEQKIYQRFFTSKYGIKYRWMRYLPS